MNAPRLPNPTHHILANNCPDVPAAQDKCRSSVVGEVMQALTLDLEALGPGMWEFTVP